MRLSNPNTSSERLRAVIPAQTDAPPSAVIQMMEKYSRILAF
jgi:hypothetical protein